MLVSRCHFLLNMFYVYTVDDIDLIASCLPAIA